VIGEVAIVCVTVLLGYGMRLYAERLRLNANVFVAYTHKREELDGQQAGEIAAMRSRLDSAEKRLAGVEFARGLRS
jgi:hypothetical protein